GVQLMMLERLDEVSVARAFGRHLVVGRHARAGFCAIASGEKEKIRAAEHRPGLIESVDAPEETSTVAAAVKSALAAFDAPARISFGATREEAICGWLGIAPSSPPRIGKGASLERLEGALGELDAPRAVAIASEVSNATTTVAWGRTRDGSIEAI